MATATLPHMLTAAEVASWLVLTTRTVVRMAKERTIPAVELPDGSFLFEPEELAEWIRSRRTGGHIDATQ
jgi:excisionase family DNA binding protein